MGDRYNAAIVYTVCRDDAPPCCRTASVPRVCWCAAAERMFRFWAAATAEAGCGRGARDDRVQIVQTVSSDQELIGAGATAEFENLYWWDESKGESVPVLEGHWKFRFDLDYEDSAFTLDGGQTFAQNGMTFTIDEITPFPRGHQGGLYRGSGGGVEQLRQRTDGR